MPDGGTSFFAALWSTIQTAAVAVVIEAVGTAIIGKLFGGQEGQSGGLKDIVTNNVLPRRIIYGTREVGGQLVYLETNGGDENHWLHMVVAISGHPVEDIIWAKLNEEIIDISGLDGSNDLYGSGSFSVKDTATGDAGAEFGTSSGTTKEAWAKIIKVNGWADANTTYVPQTYRDNPSTAPSFVQEDIRRANYVSSWLAPAGTANSDGIVSESAWETVANPLWNRSTHTLTNCAYIYLRLRYNKDRPSQSRIPKMKFTVKGKKLYDPRKDSTNPVYNSALGSGHDINDPTTWEWSENWALPIVDYLLNPEYGLKLNKDFTGEDVEIVWDSIGQAADDSDDLVAHGDSSNITNPSLYALLNPDWQPASGGNWEVPRYTLNAVITTDQKPISVVEGMLNEGAGFLAYAQAQYSLYAGKYRAPASASDILDEDDLAGPINISTSTSRANTFNKAGGTYIRQYLDDAQVDFYPIYEQTDFGIVSPENSSGQNPYELEDGEEIIKEFDFPYCLYETEAQRKARIYLERNRQALTVTGKFNLNALKYSVGDIVYLTIDRLAWGLDAQPADPLDPNYSGNAPKQFMILGATVNEDFTVDLTLREEASAIYDWNEGDAFLTDPSPNRTLNLIKRTNPINAPSWETSSQPITSSIVTYADGSTNSKTTLQWLAPEIYNLSEGTGAGRNQISHYELQYGIVTNAAAVDPVNRVTEWINYGSNIPNDASVDLQGPINIYGLTNNASQRYEFRIRAKAVYGRLSSWVYFMDSTFAPSDGNGYDVGIDTVAPAAPDSITCSTDLSSIIEVTINLPSGFSDKDVAFVELQSSSDISDKNVAPVKTYKIAVPSKDLATVGSFSVTITPDLVDTNRYFWARFIDTSGNTSTWHSGGDGTLGKALTVGSLLSLSSSSQTFSYDGSTGSNVLIGPSSVVFTANRQNITEDTSWYLQDSEGNLADFLNFQKQGAYSFTYDTWDADIYAPCISKQSDGTYRMYYTGYDLDASGGAQYGPCTATSTDLVNWTKPNLGNLGGTGTNVVIGYDMLSVCHYSIVDDTHILLIRNDDTGSTFAYEGTDGVNWTIIPNTVLTQASHGEHFEGKCIFKVNNKWRIYYSQGHFDNSFGGLRSIGYYESATSDINSTYTNQGLVSEWTSVASSLQYYDMNVYEYDGIYFAFVPLYANSVQDLLGPLHMYRSDDNCATWTDQGVILDFGANGEFDDSLITTARPILFDDGTWHLIYAGSPELHFTPQRETKFGQATSQLLTSQSNTSSTLLESAFAGITNNEFVKVTAEADGLSDSVSVVELVSGEDGTDPISHYLTNEAHTVSADSNGKNYDLTGSGGTHVVFNGLTEITTSLLHWVVGGTLSSGIWSITQNGLTLSIVEATGVYSLSGADWTSNQETFTLRTIYNGQYYDKVYTISKSKAAIFTGDALNLGRKTDDISLWYSDLTETTVLTSPWTVFTDTSNPVWDTGLRVTSSTLEEIYSEIIPVDNTKKYRLSVWLRQTGNGLTTLFVTQYNSSKNAINGTTSSATGWTNKTSLHFYTHDSITVTGSWLKYTFEFGGDATAEFDSNCAYIGIGAFTSESSTGDTTVDFNDFYVREVGIKGSDSVSVTYTNSSHSVPVTTAGDETWTGSGGDLYVFEGATRLTLANNAQTNTYPTAGRFNIDIQPFIGDTLTEPTITGDETTTATLSDWAGDLTGVTVYKLIIRATTSEDTNVYIEHYVTLTPANQGDTGNTGSAGRDATVVAGVKANYSAFNTANTGEMYVHGLDSSGNPADVDGSVVYNGAIQTITKGPVLSGATSSNTIRGYIAYNISGTNFTVNALATNKAAVRYYYDPDTDTIQWQYDNNSSWIDFDSTLNSDDIILIGVYNRSGSADSSIDSATIVAPIPLENVIIRAGQIQTTSLSALSATIGKVETRPDNSGVGNTTPRLVLEDTSSPLIIFDEDDVTKLFELKDLGTSIEVRLKGDFGLHSLNTAQAFSDAGITDLRGRLGLSEPSGGGTGGTAELSSKQSTSGATASYQYVTVPGSWTASGAENITLNFEFSDFGSGSPAPYPDTEGTWAFIWQYRLNSGTWTSIPASEVTGLTGSSSTFVEEFFSRWTYVLSIARQYIWTPPSSVTDDTIEFRLGYKITSGDKYNPYVQAASASEPLVGQGVLEAHTHTTDEITNLSSYTGFDSRYYTETEVNSLLAGKSDTGHNHTTSDITNLSSYTGFDSRYYTETEISNFFSGATAKTGYNKSNWDTAYGWGNHASQGYITTSSVTYETLNANLDVGTGSTQVARGNHTHNYLLDTTDTFTGTLTINGALTLDGITIDEAGFRGGIVEANRDGSSSYAGWGIQFSGTSQWALMASENNAGFYDDYNNDWVWYYTENGALQLRYNGTTAIQTQQYNATGNTSSAIVYDHTNTARDVGFNDLVRKADNVSSVNIRADHCGGVIYADDNTGFFAYIDSTTNSDIPQYGVVHIVNANASAGNITVSESGVSNYLYRQAPGGAIADSSVTVGPGGVATLYKVESGKFLIWGSELA